jgi:hypothetical protein
LGLTREEAASTVVPWTEGIAGRTAAAGTARVVDDVTTARPISTYLLDRGQNRLDRAGPRGRRPRPRRPGEAIERAEVHDRQRHIAITLQQSVLPDELPLVPGVAISRRYLPGSKGTEVGG